MTCYSLKFIIQKHYTDKSVTCYKMRWQWFELVWTIFCKYVRWTGNSNTMARYWSLWVQKVVGILWKWLAMCITICHSVQFLAFLFEDIKISIIVNASYVTVLVMNFLSKDHLDLIRHRTAVCNLRTFSKSTSLI